MNSGPILDCEILHSAPIGGVPADEDPVPRLDDLSRAAHIISSTLPAWAMGTRSFDLWAWSCDP